MDMQVDSRLNEISDAGMHDEIGVVISARHPDRIMASYCLALRTTTKDVILPYFTES